jgi:hypothetical protein
MAGEAVHDPVRGWLHHASQHSPTARNIMTMGSMAALKLKAAGLMAIEVKA